MLRGSNEHGFEMHYSTSVNRKRLQSFTATNNTAQKKIKRQKVSQ